MICNKCGNQIADNSTFCVYCGTQVGGEAQPAAPAQPYPQQPVQQAYPQQPAQPYQQPYQQPYPQQGYAAPQAPADPQQEAESKSILTFGILALAFGCSFYLSFLGIIFGAIEKGKANAFQATYGLTGRAKVGSILGKIGFILGIVLTALFVVWLIAIIVAASSASSYYYYY